MINRPIGNIHRKPNMYRKKVIYILIDNSTTVAANVLDSFNRIVSKLLSCIKETTTNENMYVRVLCVNKNAHWVSDEVKINDYSWIGINNESESSILESISLLLTDMRRIEENYSEFELPTILLLSGSKFENTKEIEELFTNKVFKKSERLSITTNDEVSKFLKAFSDKTFFVGERVDIDFEEVFDSDCAWPLYDDNEKIILIGYDKYHNGVFKITDVCDENNPLRNIVKEHKNILENHKILKALLMDYYPENRLKRNLIYACVTEGIVKELLSYDLVKTEDIYRLSMMLVNSYGCDKTIAEEIIMLWVDAFKIKRTDIYETSRNETNTSIDESISVLSIDDVVFNRDKKSLLNDLGLDFEDIPNGKFYIEEKNKYVETHLYYSKDENIYLGNIYKYPHNFLPNCRVYSSVNEYYRMKLYPDYSTQPYNILLGYGYYDCEFDYEREHVIDFILSNHILEKNDLVKFFIDMSDLNYGQVISEEYKNDANYLNKGLFDIEPLTKTNSEKFYKVYFPKQHFYLMYDIHGDEWFYTRGHKRRASIFSEDALKRDIVQLFLAYESYVLEEVDVECEIGQIYEKNQDFGKPTRIVDELKSVERGWIISPSSNDFMRGYFINCKFYVIEGENEGGKFWTNYRFEKSDNRDDAVVMSEYAIKNKFVQTMLSNNNLKLVETDKNLTFSKIFYNQEDVDYHLATLTKQFR